MYSLRVLERYVKAVKAHKAWIEELMQFEREKCAEYNYRPRVAFVDLHKFLITCIGAKDAQEEDAEEEVT